MDTTSRHLIMANLVQSLVYDKKNAFVLYKSFEFLISIFYFSQFSDDLEIILTWVKILKTKKATILFVGTTPSVSLIVQQNARRCNCFYVHKRWVTGILTNWRSVRTYMTKRSLGIVGQNAKLEKYCEGLLMMDKLPDLVIIVNPDNEKHAIAECDRLNIPTLTIQHKRYFRRNLMLPGSSGGLDFIKTILSLISGAIRDTKVKMGYLQIWWNR
jgi:small subunit ribosomal protein S2